MLKRNLTRQTTGVNGYLGAHVVDQLVQHGYRVRGYVADLSHTTLANPELSFRTVRSSNLALSKKSFAVYGDAVEIVALDDLVHGNFPEIFKGKFLCN